STQGSTGLTAARLGWGWIDYPSRSVVPSVTWDLIRRDETMNRSVRILIADDHPRCRRGLRDVVEGVDDIDVVCEAGDGNSALSYIRSNPPDVAILDIDM